MKIERLELFGYKRLMLANIQHFIYTPSSAYQLILGTNGSGKSSILYELTPLPAHSSNYTKDGYKDVTITHRGVEYRLISNFKTGKHSFVKDGEELNPGGTAQVQKEHVKREFNLTAELHEVLIGQARFTEMSPSDRRKWITMLSTCDYSYALGVHKKLASAARDQQGALRHIKQRLTQETNNLKGLTELETLEQKSHDLREELNVLLVSRTPGLPNYPDLSSQVDQCLYRIGNLSQKIMELTRPQPWMSQYRSPTDVEEHFHAVNSELNTATALLERSTNEYVEMEAVVGSMAGTEEIDLENIEASMMLIDQEMEGHRSKLQIFKNLQDADYLLRDTDQIIDDLIGIFNQLPDNTSRRFSQATVREAREAIVELQKVIEASNNKLSQLNARMVTMRSAKETTCPQCSYVWREGYSDREMAQLEAWVEEHEKIIDETRAVIAVHQKFLEESEEYSFTFGRLRSLNSNYPRLRPLWDFILENHLAIKAPSTQIGIFYQWRDDVVTTVAIEELERKRIRLAEMSAKQSQHGGVAHFNQRLVRLNEEVHRITEEVQALRKKSSDVRQYRSQVQQIETTMKALDVSVAELETLRLKAVDSLRNQHVDTVVAIHQTDLALMHRKLTEKHALDGIIRDLTSSHDEVEENFKALSLLADALSPTEGLIAEQLTGFITCLVGQLNSIIGTLWTYDMAVQPCGMSSGELDYRFPLQIQSAEHVAPDVAKGSKAQQQVVNFAFQLTVMLYMEMTDYPLYLDEPGEGFDEQHRTNLIGFVKQLMDANHHSQLFLVSHYAATHGSLVNSEVLVLDSNNITVPGEFNKHVVMR